MWEYNSYPNSDELYHHGIMGMKWGKRNGPPYPLGASDHSASEKKAGWRKSLDADGRVAAVKKAKKAKKDQRKSIKEHNAKLRSISRAKKEEYNKRLENNNEYQAYKNLRDDSRRKAEAMDQLVNETTSPFMAFTGSLGKSIYDNRDNRYSEIIDNIEARTGKSVANKYLKQYGEQTMAEVAAIEKKDDRIAKAVLAGSLAAIGGLYVYAIKSAR